MEMFEFITSFFKSADISIHEATMLLCFGLSWPVSVIKTFRAKSVSGKSPFFILLIAIGYMSGITHKVLYSRDWLVTLYVFNLSMVLLDLFLYTRSRYSLRAKRDVDRICKPASIPQNKLTLFL